MLNTRLRRIISILPIIMDQTSLTCRMEHYCFLCNHPTGMQLSLNTVREHIKTVKSFWGIGIAGAGLTIYSFYYCMNSYERMQYFAKALSLPEKHIFSLFFFYVLMSSFRSRIHFKRHSCRGEEMH